MQTLDVDARELHKYASHMDDPSGDPLPHRTGALLPLPVVECFHVDIIMRPLHTHLPVVRALCTC